ncbi:Mitotic spindle checkpoint component mad2 [Cymbomonas tetramitiformis]|uniref:Mitotic spindle checkpoint component mad2 n=1 Tax=Cymbomonas tetramitiformis TaxID=36881 RepID=A0AAE0KSZ3_9CHLO|nr:Mitotic spindle checkpoint component mad2 [Cymbomonas tetramitiformis]
MATAQATRNNITLRGSTEIVTEFFGYAVNSILYQRGIYPPETFERKKKYGLTMLVTSDHGLTAYLSNVLQQITEWLMEGSLQKLVLVITSSTTREVLERWAFDIEAEAPVTIDGPGVSKPEKEIMGEIQAIIRQITASVTFLPLLEDPCTFDLLVYTKNDSTVPQEWEESDPRYIADSAEVRLRSFTTKVTSSARYYKYYKSK